MPYIATSVSNIFVFDKIMHLWGKNQKKLFVPNNPKLAEVHSLISVSKASMSWENNRCLQECRRACGGLGYSYYSRFALMASNSDISQTWEGDNNVLL